MSFVTDQTEEIVSMVQDRKEPTFSGIKPESDEVTTHSKSASGGAPQASSRNSNNRNQSRSSVPQQPQATKSGLAIFALLVALIGVGVGGFSVWQLQLSQKNLVDAESRIAELEGRLNLTSSESDQSVTAIHEKLKWADSEIRKLWGVSNDKNKKAIKSASDDISKLTSDLKATAANAKAAKEASDSQKASFGTLKTLTSEQQLVLSQLSDDVAAAKKQLNKLNQLETKINELGNDIPKRIKTNEEAIQAIDSFRRSANADIQQIKQQMSAAAGP
ncbi:MAG: hypothetical protein ACRBCS_00250 [Cellvibrionaceae bacterium]